MTTYTGADPIVQEYIRSAHFASFRQEVIGNLQFGTPIQGGGQINVGTQISGRYRANPDGCGSAICNILNDTGTHHGADYLGDGQYNNMAIALLGSHELTAAPTAITFDDGATGGVRQTTIQYRTVNSTTMGSATRIPGPAGYGGVGDVQSTVVDNISYGANVGRPVIQEFVWYERYTCTYEGK